jgi:hypothetical protein
VVELVDTLVLGTSAARREGSSPFIPTNQKAFMPKIRPVKPQPTRNDSLFDLWSVVHLITGVLFGWLMAPFVALSIMVLWEPLEIFVLSPLAGQFGLLFGYESLRNSLSDIFFDFLGVALGTWLLTYFIVPPIHLF